MAYEVRWLLENRIVYVLNTGIGTADDVINSMRESTALMENSTAPVHIIIDGQTERNDISLGDLLTVMRTAPRSKNIGWAVYVSESKMNRFFGSIASQIAGAQTKAFETLPEAIAFLQRADITLPESIPLA
ncbi:MAG: hypothetical protein ABI690_10725 [Chloroflexota bacterium]